MISESDGCAERLRAKGDATQASGAVRGRERVTEGFICQPGDTSLFMTEYFSPCQSRIRNHHKVGEHEYCP